MPLDQALTALRVGVRARGRFATTGPASREDDRTSSAAPDCAGVWTAANDVCTASGLSRAVERAANADAVLYETTDSPTISSDGPHSPSSHRSRRSAVRDRVRKRPCSVGSGRKTSRRSGSRHVRGLPRGLRRRLRDGRQPPRPSGQARPVPRACDPVHRQPRSYARLVEEAARATACVLASRDNGGLSLYSQSIAEVLAFAAPLTIERQADLDAPALAEARGFRAADAPEQLPDQDMLF